MRGGLYWLIHKINENSIEEKIVKESKVSWEFIKSYMDNEKRLILGKGSFGKVRLALCIFGNGNVDIGELICVKKSIKSERFKDLREKTLNVFEDFLAKKIFDSIYAPKPLDIAITKKKTYFFMDIIPEHTAFKIFEMPSCQKWEYYKPYFTEIMISMRDLLINHKILNTDLKPGNTLFDKISKSCSI